MSDPASNVLPFQVKPKQLKRQYKRQTYTVTFTPKTKKWHWEVVVTTTLKYGEDADTQIKAFRAAEKFIDQHVKG